MRKKIGIDFHVFDGKYQGSRTHLIEILSRVVKLATDMEFFVFLNNIEKLLEFYPVFTAKNVFCVPMPATNPVKRLCWVLPNLQRDKSLDLLHTQYIIPSPSFSRCVVTIHDILFETHPEYFTFFFQHRSKFLVRSSAVRANHVFTVSDFCKNELVQKYHLNPDNISIIHNGVDKTRFHPGFSEKKLVEKWGLTPGNYILTVGRLEPRKNHATLIQAYAALGRDAPPLVIIGQRDFKYEFLNLLDKLGINNKVFILDTVEDADLPAILRHATLFIYPSYAEGFGLPPLEAMASGVPVICSNTTAIPEVTGTAALLFTPSDAKQLTEAIRTALTDVSLQKSMRDAGLKQSDKYTWEKAAEVTLEGYYKALS